VVEEARVPGQPPTIGKQVVNFIIRVYGIKYKIFHDHVTLKILIGRFSRNFFSRTAEGIELKSGIYVPMNVFNMCCYCLRHLKIQKLIEQKIIIRWQNFQIKFIIPADQLVKLTTH
jgi:hypothetical protein